MILFLVSMNDTSLYKNIPQEEGIGVVCKAYEKLLNEMLRLILKENSFQFNGEIFLQTYETAM